jgi:hypothetical protein
MATPSSSPAITQYIELLARPAKLTVLLYSLIIVPGRLTAALLVDAVGRTLQAPPSLPIENTHATGMPYSCRTARTVKSDMPMRPCRSVPSRKNTPRHVGSLLACSSGPLAPLREGLAHDDVREILGVGAGGPAGPPAEEEEEAATAVCKRPPAVAVWDEALEVEGEAAAVDGGERRAGEGMNTGSPVIGGQPWSSNSESKAW